MKLRELLSNIDYVEFKGNADEEIANVTIFDENNTDKSLIMWVNSRNAHRAEGLRVGTLIHGNSDHIAQNSNCNYIIVEKPRATFNKVLSLLHPKSHKSGIAASAIVAEGCTIANTAFIGHNVVIEKGCTIGENTYIGHNTVIKEGSIIGKDVIIGSNNVIGGIGFGYEKDIDGVYNQMTHIGNVVIEDKVEIGNNSCIDRAVMGSTILKENCKIDNLVHIAHGVEIGKNSLIIAHAMVAGSTKIGENVWVAPGAQILNKIRVADDAVIGMGAVLLKPVELRGDVVVGNPAKSIKK
jgi:UDP-3-O-[3-hydroxymyristoyl] glucosamine N-acyltransferase